MGKNVKTPTILQVEAVECGAAALAMILAYHGRWMKLEDLRVECGVSRDGSKATNILKCARAHGLEAAGKRYELERLAEIELPVIAFVNMNHFVVVEAIGRNGYRLNDPAVGRRWVSAEEFDGMFTGVTLTFKPGDEFQTTAKPAGQLRGVMDQLQGQSSAVALVVLTGLSLVATGLVLPAFMKVFIDDFIMDKQHDWLWGIGVLMVCVVLLQSGFTWMQGTYKARLQTKLSAVLNAKIAWHMIRLPIPFFGQRLAGSLSSRGHMASQLASLSSESLLAAILESVTIIFFIVILALYSLPIAGVVAVLMLCNVGLVLTFQQSMKQSAIKVSTEMMSLQGKTFIGLQSIESIKSSGTEDRFFQGWSGSHANLINAQANVTTQTALIAATPGFTTLLTKALSLMIGGALVMEGELTIGALVACIALVTAVDKPFHELVVNVQALMKAQGSLGQVRDILDYPQAPEFAGEGADGSRRGSAPPKLSGAVNVRDMTFGYSPLAAPLVSEFSLNIPAGRSVALVGGSGSGKSTIGKVITGLYPAWSGQILFDGVEIGDLDREVLRNSIAVVDQSITLFEDTFRENIRMWDKTIDEQQIIQAAKDAEIHDLICGSENGYDTLIEEGGRNLSGGQRQRIEIARALVQKASILVLDEATSALDPIVEARIMENIRRRNCTCIVIAHRLSTIRDCDEIVVLSKGNIVERGPHDTLKSSGGPYQSLLEA